MADTSGPLSLDEIVRDIAKQLHSLKELHPKDPTIAFKTCEIELSVAASAEGGGGIKFYIFNAEAKAKAEHVSKVKLSFDAVTEFALPAGDENTRLVHRRASRRGRNS